MTGKELFRKIWAAAVAQRFKRALDLMCMYRTSEGIGCAIGAAFVPIKDAPKCEGASVSKATIQLAPQSSWCNQLVKILDRTAPGWRENVSLLHSCQDAHDKACNSANYRERLAAIGHANNYF